MFVNFQFRNSFDGSIGQVAIRAKDIQYVNSLDGEDGMTHVVTYQGQAWTVVGSFRDVAFKIEKAQEGRGG